MNEHQNQNAAEVARRTDLRSRIRPLNQETPDEVFLPFLDLCFNWSMDKPRIETDELFERDDAAFYFKNWGRTGDIAAAAYAPRPDAEETAHGKDPAGEGSDPKGSADGPFAEKDSGEESAPEIVGLAWLRLADIDAVTTSDFTGYGWVAADIPELSLAVLPDHQSQGIGGTLLDVVCTLAKMSGFPAVSLSVEDGNGAARLYHDRGFVAVGRNGDADILVKRLK